MKPLPAEGSVGDRRSSGTPMLPTPLPQNGGSRTGANRKMPATPGQRAYPWLLVIATGVAGFFCYLYITKPVFYPAPAIAPTMAQSPALSPITPLEKTPMASLAPAAPGPFSDRLPGDPASRAAAPPRGSATGKPSNANPFEETNFQVQHVITAEAPNGVVKRLDFKVPVLYRSRNLRWTKTEVSTARELLGRLADYQEKTRALRAEGAALSTAWNQLIEQSIPTVGLQADSPTLPSNQESIRSTTVPNGPEAIRIQPVVK